MKIDKYTKVVLTGILILLGVIAFDYKPTLNAQAGIMDGGEMISAGKNKNVWHLKDGKVRYCFLGAGVKCFKWSN